MDHTLKNGNLEITVSSLGAELRSLKKHGKELMWQADPKYWGRTSPILFPFVGACYNKEYRHEGKTYSMTQHGFARDMEFTLKDSSEDELLFELTSSEDTRGKYPFDFVLRIGYRLKADAVVVSWEVHNPADKELLFSIGGHPAFNCKLSETRLAFYKDGAAVEGNLVSNVVSMDGSGCLSDRTIDVATEAGQLQLSKEIFDEDALVLENRQADTVAILDVTGSEVLRMSFDAPLFGIWSPDGKDAPFVCIEPWWGRCDRVGFDKELSEREYINCLGPRESFKTSYTIE